MIQNPDSKFPLELKKLLNIFFCISIVNAKKLVKEYSSEGLLHTNDSMTLMSIVLEEAHTVLL
jgi:hypothetical protein